MAGNFFSRYAAFVARRPKTMVLGVLGFELLCLLWMGVLASKGRVPDVYGPYDIILEGTTGLMDPVSSARAPPGRGCMRSLPL